MNDQIQTELNQIETHHKVRILYACESGSRAWGFASTNSDYDVRFIYMHDLNHYLKLNTGRDVIELPITDELDINGWDIYKACHLLRKSNPALIEWLGSPIVYRDSLNVALTMRQILSQHFSQRACCEHYLSMAKSNYHNFIQNRPLIPRKKYLYTMRPICCLMWLLDHHTFPPTSFHDTRQNIDLPNNISTQLDQLIKEKAQSSEMDKMQKNKALDTFITNALQTLPDRINQIPSNHFPSNPLDKMIHQLLTSNTTTPS